VAAADCGAAGMALKVQQICMRFALVAIVLHKVEAQCEDETCGVTDAQRPIQSSALLQVQMKDNTYISGREAPLDEAGYQQIAALCCHHEMSLFIGREIQSQNFTVCDLSDLHGFVHWYDCTNDKYTFAKLKAEIASVPEKPCSWLGHADKCPVKGVNCFDFPPAPAVPSDSLPGDTAPMTEAGYAGVAKRCDHVEMEKYVRREIDNQTLSVCDEGGLQGFLHWFDCTDDDQSYQKLKEGIMMARSGLPPLCPWLGTAGEPCPPKGHNCPVVEEAEPAAHRRRTACR
jgi:hypothetical protein